MNKDNFDRMIKGVGNEMAGLLYCSLGATARYSVMVGEEAMRQVREACEPLNILVEEALRGGEVK